MTRTARPRTALLRLALLAAAIALPFASAQVGRPVGDFVAALGLAPVDVAASPVVATTAGGRSLDLDVRGGALYTVAGSAAFDEAALAEAAQVIAVATGYGDAIEGPVVAFFQQNLPALAGAGVRVIRVEQYLLELDVTGAGAPYDVRWSLALAEVPEGAFPVARHAKGPADARYVIREFSDLQCPFCARFATDVLPTLEAELLARGDVRFEYHHFPLVSIHANAFRAAEASECVVDANPDDPEAFWTYSEALFERMQAWGAIGDPDGYFVNVAGQVGLATDGMAACLADGTYTQAVGEAYDAAVRLGLNGTPTLFVGPYRLGDFSQLGAYLDAFALIDAFAEDPTGD